MTCDDVRRELLVRPTREFADVLRDHPCAACEALARRLTEEESAMYATVTQWMERPPARTATRSRRWPVVLLAAAAAGALWVGWRGPEPMPPTERGLGAVPAVPPPPATTGTIEVQQGASVMLKTPRPVEQVALDAPGVSVAQIGEDHVLVGGLAEGGRGRLRIDLAERDTPLVYEVDVGPARTELPTDEASFTVRIGAATTLPLHDPPFDVRTIDPGVASIARNGDRLEVSVTGHRAGFTDVWVVYPEGPPDVWVVQVTP